MDAFSHQELNCSIFRRINDLLLTAAMDGSKLWSWSRPRVLTLALPSWLGGEQWLQGPMDLSTFRPLGCGVSACVEVWCVQVVEANILGQVLLVSPLASFWRPSGQNQGKMG